MLILSLGAWSFSFRGVRRGGVLCIKMNLVSFLSHPPEDKQKKKRQQKEKNTEGSKTLRRSKTFVNLLFKRERRREASREKRDTGTDGTHRGRSKSPSHHADRG